VLSVVLSLRLAGLGHVRHESGFRRTARPGGPGCAAVPAGRSAGLGRCGRRLESAWSNGKPAYRCRHGHTSATSPEPGRPKNSHVREEQILPHLAAIAILLRLGGRADSRSEPVAAAQVTSPAGTADLIDQLRACSVTLMGPSGHTERDIGPCAGDSVPVAAGG
jgi:site-specific DNA recombinase